MTEFPCFVDVYYDCDKEEPCFANPEGRAGFFYRYTQRLNNEYDYRVFHNNLNKITEIKKTHENSNLHFTCVYTKAPAMLAVENVTAGKREL